VIRALLKRGGIAVLVIVMLALALIGLLTVSRGTPVSRVVSLGDAGGAPAVSDSLFARTMELFTGTHISPGNQVDVLSNGDETYAPLWRDLRSARSTITVQMYFAKPGRVADTMAVVLAERARAKVRVLLLLDAFGAQELRGEWERRVRASGVELAWLRPLALFELNKAAQRSHARVVVVDGRLGSTGGFGLADYWLGDGDAPDQWREANVRFEGPAVAQLQAVFAAGWAEARGELLTGDVFFPSHMFEPAGTEEAGLFYSLPTIGSTPGERFLAITISAARRTLYIANSYFIPDDDFRRFLVAAARRGVDVRVLVPGDETDVKTVLFASRWRYLELLEGGVRIFEYQPTMMHAKTIVVDGLWSAIGSFNFDNRSMVFNNETTLLVLSARTGARMDSLFLRDLGQAREIRLEAWRHRGAWERVKEVGATLLSRVL
jgi:cardiolipin synthase